MLIECCSVVRLKRPASCASVARPRRRAKRAALILSRGSTPARGDPVRKCAAHTKLVVRVQPGVRLRFRASILQTRRPVSVISSNGRAQRRGAAGARVRGIASPLAVPSSAAAPHAHATSGTQWQQRRRRHRASLRHAAAQHAGPRLSHLFKTPGSAAGGKGHVGSCPSTFSLMQAHAGYGRAPCF